MRLTSEPPKPKTIGDLGPGSLCRIRRTGAARNVPPTDAPLLVMEADEEDDDDTVVAVDTDRGGLRQCPQYDACRRVIGGADGGRGRVRIVKSASANPPSVTHCPYCGSSDIYTCHRVPRCGACRSVFFVRFSRRLRRTQRCGSKTTQTPAPRCEQVVAALSGMLQSYDILTNESPLSSNALALGVIRGAFIGAVDAARRIVTAPASTPLIEHRTGDHA